MVDEWETRPISEIGKDCQCFPGILGKTKRLISAVRFGFAFINGLSISDLQLYRWIVEALKKNKMIEFLPESKVAEPVKESEMKKDKTIEPHPVSTGEFYDPDRIDRIISLINKEVASEKLSAVRNVLHLLFPAPGQPIFKADRTLPDMQTMVLRVLNDKGEYHIDQIATAVMLGSTYCIGLNHNNVDVYLYIISAIQEDIEMQMHKQMQIHKQ